MEQFKNPPIQEVLIDIQVTLPAEVSLDALKKFHDGLESRFPEKQERISWQQGFQISAVGEAHAMTSSRSFDGYLFKCAQDGKVVQVRRDGFTFNKLKPYSKWETFSAEARELWERYAQLARPVSVQRVSLRYLNRIVLPLPLGDFRDYCLLFPDIPSGMPQGVSDFFLRFATPVPDILSCAMITMTFEPPAAGITSLSMIFDIEAIHLFDSLNVDVEVIWRKLAELRDLKNKVFDSGLTEKAKRLFQ